MLTLTDRLSAYQVGDVMTRDVVTLLATSTMAEAAVQLNQHQVTGAPVVDEQGRCIGILSGSDFTLLKAEEAGGAHKCNCGSSNHPEELNSFDKVRHDLVQSRMSTAVQTIKEDALLLTAASCMCNEHIHRLLVVDKNTKPVGVLSSLDIVATLITLAE